MSQNTNSPAVPAAGGAPNMTGVNNALAARGQAPIHLNSAVSVTGSGADAVRNPMPPSAPQGNEYQEFLAWKQSQAQQPAQQPYQQPYQPQQPAYQPDPYGAPAYVPPQTWQQQWLPPQGYVDPYQQPQQFQNPQQGWYQPQQVQTPNPYGQPYNPQGQQDWGSPFQGGQPFQQQPQQAVTQPATQPQQPQQAPVQYDYSAVQNLTENAALNAGISAFFGNSTIDPTTIPTAIEALKTGDATLFDKAAVAATHGLQVANQIEVLVNAQAQEKEAATTRLKSEVYTAAGGESNWEQAKAYWNSTASHAQVADVNHLMDAVGSRESITAAVQKVIAHAAQNGVIQHAQPFMGAPSAAPSKGITATEHKEKRAAILAKLGNSSIVGSPFEAELAQLNEQRMVGRNNGI